MDLSLYKEESQLKKRKSTKRKASSPPKTTTAASPAKKSPEQAKVRKIAPKFKSELAKKNTVLKKALITKTKKNLSGRAERAAKRSLEVLKNSTKHTPVIDHKKAKVLAKVARKKNSGSKIKQQPPSKQSEFCFFNIERPESALKRLFNFRCKNSEAAELFCEETSCNKEACRSSDNTKVQKRKKVVVKDYATIFFSVRT